MSQDVEQEVELCLAIVDAPLSPRDRKGTMQPIFEILSLWVSCNIYAEDLSSLKEGCGVQSTVECPPSLHRDCAAMEMVAIDVDSSTVVS